MPGQMHVMYLNTEDLSREVSAGRVHFWAVARGLAALGCRVTVIAPRYRGNQISLPSGIFGLFLPVPLKNALSLLAFELQLLLLLPWLVVRQRPTSILVRGGGPAWMPGVIFLAFRLCGVPVTLECNGIAWEELVKRKASPLLVWFVRFSAWQQARMCNRIIAVTREIGDAYCDLARRPRGVATEIPNGVDPGELSVSEEERLEARRAEGIPDDCLVVGYVGSFTVWHGIPEVLDAAAILRTAGVDNVVFLLAGTGEFLAEAQRRKEAGALENVRFLGNARDRNELRFWMASFDVGLCTNRPGHWSPLKFFEYLAIGIPIIGTGVPQVLRILRDADAGIAMETPSGEQIADLVRMILGSRERWNETGKKNRLLAERVHSWANVAEQVLGVLSQPVPDRPPSDHPGISLIMTVSLSWRLVDGYPQFLQSRGLRVQCISGGGEELTALGAIGIAADPVEMSRRISPVADLVSLIRLCRSLRRHRPAVVHAGTPKGGLLGMIAAALCGVKTRVYTIHGLPLVTSRGLRRLVLVWSERIASHLATQVLCVSESVRAIAVAERLCPAGKVKVLGHGSANGVDAQGRFNPARCGNEARMTTRRTLGVPEDAPVVGFVGRLVRDKGVEDLVGAWRTVRDQYPDARLLVIGPAEARDALDPATVAALHDDSTIAVLGARWDTPGLLAAMDVLCLPTYREGFPTVLLEAAAMELPVVATSVTGCVDAVSDGETGTLVPPRNPPALAAALGRYLGSDELRRSHGAAARRRAVHDYRPEALWEAQLGQYGRSARGSAFHLTEGTVRAHQTVPISESRV
jgi:glycosyltransferase involved in cell wall biosynthesis